jgi:hypothetical protein
MQERLGKRKEERPGRSSGPEGAGLEPGYTIPRKSRPHNWACDCRGNGLGNPARRWGSDVARGKYALQLTIISLSYISSH